MNLELKTKKINQLRYNPVYKIIIQYYIIVYNFYSNTERSHANDGETLFEMNFEIAGYILGCC